MKFLVLGSGGQFGFSFLGILKNFENSIKEVQEISGASIGSLIGLFLAAGKSVDEISEFCFNYDQSSFTKFNLKKFITTYGFLDLLGLKDNIIENLGFDPKFKDLEKKIYISAYNLNLEKTEYFSVDTHPDMSAIDAVCLSMSIPFLFSSEPFNGFHYIDGGAFENAPLPPFFGKPAQEILIIQTCFKNINNIEINNLKEFIIKIIFNCMKKITITYDSRKYNTLTIPHIDNATSLDFKMDLDTKWKLFFHGFNLARCSQFPEE